MQSRDKIGYGRIDPEECEMGRSVDQIIAELSAARRLKVKAKARQLASAMIRDTSKVMPGSKSARRQKARGATKGA